MLLAGMGAPPPSGVKSAMLALLMMETLVCDCRYIRSMYWPKWNSPASVVGVPGFLGKFGRSSRGFHGVHGFPSSSGPAAFPPVPLNGLTVNPASADDGPGPCASARKLCGLLVLDRTMCV